MKWLHSCSLPRFYIDVSYAVKDVFGYFTVLTWRYKRQCLTETACDKLPSVEDTSIKSVELGFGWNSQSQKYHLLAFHFTENCC